MKRGDLEAWAFPWRARIENELVRWLRSLAPASALREAMTYSVAAGGKRLRPLLCLASAAAVGGNLEQGLPPAIALELVHTYSLVHDDLPCMDDDDLRRGRPTCHRAYGEAQALLAGDGLLTLAFGVLAEGISDPKTCVAVVAELAGAAGPAGMVLGQQLDLEGRTGVPELERLHALKTGALFAASVRSGALVAGATTSQLESLTRYAGAFGLAFQIADDVLDVVGDTARLGKPVGSDEAQGKFTFVSALGIDASRQRANQLRDDALVELREWGPSADPLRWLAHLAVERDR